MNNFYSYFLPFLLKDTQFAGFFFSYFPFFLFNFSPLLSPFPYLCLSFSLKMGCIIPLALLNLPLSMFRKMIQVTRITWHLDKQQDYPKTYECISKRHSWILPSLKMFWKLYKTAYTQKITSVFKVCKTSWIFFNAMNLYEIIIFHHTIRKIKPLYKILSKYCPIHRV